MVQGPGRGIDDILRSELHGSQIPKARDRVIGLARSGAIGMLDEQEDLVVKVGPLDVTLVDVEALSGVIVPPPGPAIGGVDNINLLLDPEIRDSHGSQGSHCGRVNG
ncbi:uncharacterized protein N7459_005444 [Penicillium hispanicum]|uniref:uncharacterized protein n=1 Tax=Penicillium hispanicum TaxID=1080232 RepID=UPI0025405EB6|nr:uncharacterized protein N7459_005444 [Penicillium hispanicum]KAJ5579459.1 hypothetical protein N7459_005444 [Penicillium hispanicum]